jgi:multiple sugar transport system substrate-binding protein
MAPATVAPWQQGSQILGLPQQAVPVMLFYNRALVDAAGVPSPSAGWDWATWRDAARLLSDPAKGQYGTAMGGWDGLVWGNGGELFNPERTKTLLDQPAAAQGVQFGADMVALDHSAPVPQAAGGPDPVKLFREGKLATLPAPSSLAAELERTPPAFAWDLAPMPAGAVHVTRLTVSGIGASAHTSHPHEAASFIGWATGEDGMAAYGAAFPFAATPRASAQAAGARATAQRPGAKLVVEALSYGRVQPFVERWPQISEAVNQALVPVWQGQESAAAAYQHVAPQINALLAAA